MGALSHNMVLSLVSVEVIQEQFFVDLRHDKIKDGNNISRVVLDLSVKAGVKLVDVLTVNI